MSIVINLTFVINNCHNCQFVKNCTIPTKSTKTLYGFLATSGRGLWQYLADFQLILELEAPSKIPGTCNVLSRKQQEKKNKYLHHLQHQSLLLEEVEDIQVVVVEVHQQVLQLPYRTKLTR